MWRQLIFLTGLVFVIAGYAGDRPTWTEYPSFKRPGIAGTVRADLDGDGELEIVTTGMLRESFPDQRSVLAVVDAEPALSNALRVTHLERIQRAIVGRIVVHSPGQGMADRVIAVVADLQGVHIVQFTGLGLDQVSRTVVTPDFGLLSIADIDGDDEPELLGWVQGSSIRRAAVVDLATGSLEWYDAYPMDTAAVGQLDTDPALEIMVSHQSGTRVLDGSTHASQWSGASSTDNQIMVGNFIGDPDVQEFALAKVSGAVHVFASQPSIALAHVHPVGELTPLAVYDVNADGRDDLILESRSDNAIRAVDLVTGQSLLNLFVWANSLGGMVVGQLDSDPDLDFFFASGVAGVTSTTTFSSLHIVSAPEGRVKWRRFEETGPYSTLARGDLDGDGRDEVAYTSHNSMGDRLGPALHVHDVETGVPRRLTGLTLDSLLLGQDSERGPSIRIGNIDADPQLEIVVGHQYISNMAISVIDGLSLQVQWERSYGFIYPGIHDLELVGEGVGSKIVVVTRENVVRLDGQSGAPEWTSPLLLGVGARRIVLGHLDADPDPELSVSVGAQVRIMDVATGQTVREMTAPGVILGQRIENVTAGCRHVLILANQLRRHHCQTGQLLSARSLPFVADLVTFDADSDGILVLGSGEVIRAIDGQGVVIAQWSGLGPRVGWGSHAAVDSSDDGMSILVGSEDAVHRLDLRFRIFSDGMESGGP